MAPTVVVEEKESSVEVLEVRVSVEEERGYQAVRIGLSLFFNLLRGRWRSRLSEQGMSLFMRMWRKEQGLSLFLRMLRWERG